MVTINGCSSAMSDTFNFIGSSVAALPTDAFAVYPNPTNGIIWIKHDGMSLTSANISLQDVNGRSLMSRYEQNTSDDAAIQWDLSSLPSGIYLIRIETKESTTVHRIQKLN